jgi:hypothetical protein
MTSRLKGHALITAKEVRAWHRAHKAAVAGLPSAADAENKHV